MEIAAATDCSLEQLADLSVCKSPYGRHLPLGDAGRTSVRWGIV